MRLILKVWSLINLFALIMDNRPVYSGYPDFFKSQEPIDDLSVVPPEQWKQKTDGQLLFPETKFINRCRGWVRNLIRSLH